MLPTNIDGVLTALSGIIDDCRRTRNRLGYFACLYLHVTRQIKAGIEQGFFQDAGRVEKLDVVFANRYLLAVQQHQSRQQPTLAWQESFRCDRRYWPIVVQHLLVACAAHIELDLGVALAEVCPAGELDSFRADFDRVNAILASVLGLLNEDLEAIWPPYKLIRKIAGPAEDAIINFSMREARDSAWDFAKELSLKTPAARQKAITERDAIVANVGALIAQPPWPATLILKWIRLGERKSVVQIIDLMLATDVSASLRMKALLSAS